MKQIIKLVTKRGTFYEIGMDDSSGNVPKFIKDFKTYYEIEFEHGNFVTRENEPAYAIIGKVGKKVKPNLKVV